MAKKRKPKMPRRRNMVVVALIARKGAGAGKHQNRVRRAMQVPRKAKHKGLCRDLPHLDLPLRLAPRPPSRECVWKRR